MLEIEMHCFERGRTLNLFCRVYKDIQQLRAEFDINVGYKTLIYELFYVGKTV